MPLGCAPQVPTARPQNSNDFISRSQGSAFGMMISAGHAWRPTIAPRASGTLWLRVDTLIHGQVQNRAVHFSSSGLVTLHLSNETHGH